MGDGSNADQYEILRKKVYNLVEKDIIDEHDVLRAKVEGKQIEIPLEGLVGKQRTYVIAAVRYQIKLDKLSGEYPATKKALEVPQFKGDEAASLIGETLIGLGDQNSDKVRNIALAQNETSLKMALDCLEKARPMLNEQIKLQALARPK